MDTNKPFSFSRERLEFLLSSVGKYDVKNMSEEEMEEELENEFSVESLSHPKYIDKEYSKSGSVQQYSFPEDTRDKTYIYLLCRSQNWGYAFLSLSKNEMQALDNGDIYLKLNEFEDIKDKEPIDSTDIPLKKGTNCIIINFPKAPAIYNISLLRKDRDKVVVLSESTKNRLRKRNIHDSQFTQEEKDLMTLPFIANNCLVIKDFDIERLLE